MVIHLFGLQVPSLPETCLVIHSWNEFEKACYLTVHFYLRSSVCFLLSCRTRITDSFLNLVLFLFLLIFMSTPQIRRSILNEDEYGFRKAKRPIYYDDGLEVIAWLHLLHTCPPNSTAHSYDIYLIFFFTFFLLWKAENQADIKCKNKPTEFCH